LLFEIPKATFTRFKVYPKGRIRGDEGEQPVWRIPNKKLCASTSTKVELIVRPIKSMKKQKSMMELKSMEEMKNESTKSIGCSGNGETFTL